MVSFSVLILGLLWFFQIISLNKFYEKSKVREINKTVNDINEAYYNEKLLDDADLISHDTGI